MGLPHEDVDSPFIEDAQHWIAVYDELLTVKRLLLDRAEEVLKGSSDDALREANVDQRLLRAQAARYEVRRSYWVRRAEELLALGLADNPASEESA